MIFVTQGLFTVKTGGCQCYSLLLPPKRNSEVRLAIACSFVLFSSLQKSTIRLQASGILSFGTVKTTRIKPGNPKQLPGRQKTDFFDTKALHKFTHYSFLKKSQ